MSHRVLLSFENIPTVGVLVREHPNFIVGTWVIGGVFTILTCLVFALLRKQHKFPKEYVELGDENEESVITNQNAKFLISELNDTPNNP